MRIFTNWGIASVFALGALMGCRQQAAKSGFDHAGYTNGPHGYRVVATADSKLTNDWLLDNYYTRGTRLVLKDGDAYQVEYQLDTDGDGQGDQSETLPLYDLRYKHRQRDAVIWLRTFPISTDLREKELRVLLHRYVDEVAGAGYEAVQLHANRHIVSEKRYAAEVLEEGNASLAGVEAYEATIEVANVDRLKLEENRREVRVRLVLARPGFSIDVTRLGKRPVSFPVLLLAGYANLPGDFEQDSPAFESLLQQIAIHNQRGYQSSVIPTEKADQPSTEDEPAEEKPPEPSDDGSPPSEEDDDSDDSGAQAETPEPATDEGKAL